MTAPEHLTIKGPEDILGFVPHALGYWPADSLVAVTMQGNRLGATLRVDLPDHDWRRNPRDFAGTVTDYLQADSDADGTLLMFFTNDGWQQSAGIHTALLAALEASLGSAGMPVRDAWYVGDTHWRNAYCADPGCCPLPGRPVDEIRDSRLNAEMVFRGSLVGSPPADDAGDCSGRPGTESLSVLAAEQRWSEELDLRRRSRPQFDDVLDIWNQALEAAPGDELPPEVQGFLRASLRVPPWRDAVLVMTAAGRAAAEHGAAEFGIFDDDAALPPVHPAQGGRIGKAAEVHPGRTSGGSTASCAGSEPAFIPGPVPGYGDVLLGLSPSLPDWRGMKNLDRVLRQLSGAGAGEARAAALTASGWIEWCRGRGSFADALLNRALEEQRGYRLAELLSELVRRGTICGWAGRREAAWQKFEPDAA